MLAMIHQRFSCLAVLLLGSALAAQEPRPDPVAVPETWPMHRGHPGLLGVATGSLADRFEVAWFFETGGAILSSPVVTGGLVYFGSSDQSVYAVDLRTGEKKWSYETEDMVETYREMITP